MATNLATCCNTQLSLQLILTLVICVAFRLLGRYSVADDRMSFISKTANLQGCSGRTCSLARPHLHWSDE